MGVYVTVRGWLECDHAQLLLIREFVSVGDSEPAYSGGWTFPERQCAWTSLVFFGADMRAQHVRPLLDQLRAVARVPASHEDDDPVRGLFVASHETEGAQEWRIHGGDLVIVDAGDRYGYLDD